MDIRVVVTEEHYKESSKRCLPLGPGSRSRNCLIHAAMVSAGVKGEYLSVSTTASFFYRLWPFPGYETGTTSVRFELPEAAQRAIYLFDLSCADPSLFQFPIVFTLENVPEWALVRK